MNDAVTVRPAHAGDAHDIARIYSAYVTGSVASFEEDPPTAEVVEERMLAEPRLPWLVAVAGYQLLGYCYASRHRARAAYRWSVDVSVYLDDGRRGHGLGRALYARLLPEVRTLGYVCAYAGIALPNEASVRLHERLGFTSVGVFRHVGFKHGKWHDVGWWQLTLTDPPAAPGEPRRWSGGA